ncbi:MAG: YfhO family protein [Clostridiales bacterium]|nr:YfhO family protein [Clostridiales bacterium]
MNTKQKELNKSVITVVIISAAITFFAVLPTVIKYRGSLYLFGDYMTQILPFIKESRRLIRAGGATWSMNSFLGADFFGVYSYYTLGDPFFYLLVLLPEALIAKGLTVVFIIKHALAAAFAFLYLKNYVSKPFYAQAGALIYTFSSFTFDSTYYYIFLNTIAFFPLVLMLCDRCLGKKSRILFAFAVAIHAATNYYMFVGTSVFILIYLFFKVRYEAELSWKNAAGCLMFYALGAACAAVVLLPGALTLLDTGKAVNSFSTFFLRGLACLPQALKIVKTIILPSEGILGSANGFTYSNFCSNAAFLPLFGAFYSITALFVKEKKWYFKLIRLLFLLSLIPFGSSIFSLFSNPNYTRWWYAFVLMSALCSIVIIDDMDRNRLLYRSEMRKSAKLIAVGSAVTMGLPLIAKLLFSNSKMIAAVEAKLPSGAMTALNNSGFTKKFNAENIRYVVTFLALCLLSYFVLFLLTKKQAVFDPQKLIPVLVAVCALSYCVYLTNEGNVLSHEVKKEVAFVSQNAETDRVDYTYRTDYRNIFHNMGMVVNKPTVNTFNSFKSKAVCSFCDLAGIETDSFAKKRFDTPAIQAVLSIKQTVNADGETTDCPYYVPFGFEYDSYIEVSAEEIRSTGDKNENNQRIQNMCSACYLDSATAQHLSPLLSEFEGRSADWKEAVKHAQNTACTEVHIDQNTVTAVSDGEKTRLIYFSIPHDRGWKAYVNGKQTEIYTVNGGMMGIVVGSGQSNIRFVYQTPGLKAGAVISGIAIICMMAFAFFNKKKAKYTDPVS